MKKLAALARLEHLNFICVIRAIRGPVLDLSYGESLMVNVRKQLTNQFKETTNGKSVIRRLPQFVGQLHSIHSSNRAGDALGATTVIQSPLPMFPTFRGFHQASRRLIGDWVGLRRSTSKTKRPRAI